MADQYQLRDNAAELEADDLSGEDLGLDESLLSSDPALHAALVELYHKKWILENLKAQAEMNAMERRHREAKAVDGIGEIVRRVHPTAYHAWGQQEGYDCWKEKLFTRYFDRIAPECKVKSTGTRTQVQVLELPVGERAQPKFRKTYRPAEAGGPSKRLEGACA